MKKRLFLILVLVFALCLCACSQPSVEEVPPPTEYTFPEGTSVLGVSIAGLNRSSAWSAVEKAVSEHTMALSVDGVETTVNAQDIDLSCSEERFNAIADAYEAGADVDFTGLVSFNEGKLRAIVSESFNKPVTEAALTYDEATGSFVLTPDAIGQISNPNVLVDSMRGSIVNLESQQTLTDVSQIIQPVIKDEDEAVTQALAQVNTMNTVALTYTFTAEDTTSTHEIPADIIRSFISLGNDSVTPGINYNALESYVAELSETYSASSTKGNFKTTGGGTVGLTVSYNGVYVDQDSLVEDIATCIMEGTSGTRTAPFQAAGIRTMPYGGTYIEVNLDAQKLWFYKYGECILTSNLVSGKVSAEWFTPNGVFSIYAKEESTYLVGEDYRTFVNYWMPFYGGYGLHDATWRGSFGGDIYVYGGSHGCVNLPLSSASKIYNNAPVGTKVIVYGGRRSAPAQAQSLAGTTAYTVADDIGSFTLDISPRYGSPKMSYSSSNSKVATVNSSGVVTVKSVGDVTITVSVPSSDGYTSATTNVTISVKSACDYGRHKMGKPTVVTAATCQPGVEKVSCSKCSHSEEREIPAKNKHKYGEWKVVEAPTCGAKGIEERTCSTCKLVTETREVAATGKHTPGDPVTVKEPTCTAKGKTETRCTVCDKVTATGELDKNPDAHTPGELKIVEATCTKDGSKKQSCTKCKAVLVDEVIPAKGHSHSWVETKAPTCTAEGEQKQTCSVCGDVAATEVIPAKGHSHGWVTTKNPTCSADGERQNICSVCGDVAGVESVGATGHSYSGGSCSVCGAADPNYVPPTEAPAPPPETQEAAAAESEG